MAVTCVDTAPSRLPFLSQVVDASQSIDEVHDNIKRLSLSALTAAEHQPIAELWR